MLKGFFTKSTIGSIIFFFLFFSLMYLYINSRKELEVVTIYKTTPYSGKSTNPPSNQKSTILEETEKNNNAFVENSIPHISEKTEEADFKETDNFDIYDAFLSEGFLDGNNELSEDVPISPYGFGPYPEIPSDYPGPPPMWEGVSLDELGFTENGKKNAELLSRVMIKLWVEKGIGSRLGGSIEDQSGLVYPFYDNTIYVKREIFRDEDGNETSTGARIVAPGNMIISGEDLERFRILGETPPGVNVLQLDTDGINPYEFLNLNQ